MLKKFLFLSVTLVLLILFSLSPRTAALNSCAGNFCYDDNNSINVGDSFTWIYEKENSGILNYYNRIDKGLPSDFNENSVEPALINIEIIRDIQGIDNNQYYSNGDEYFKTSITIDGSNAGSNIENKLSESLLIYPTVRSFGNDLVNSFEFLVSTIPNEASNTSRSLSYYELEIIQRYINNGIYFEVINIEVADSPTRTNILLSSTSIQQIHISTGLMLSHSLTLQDYEKDEQYLADLILTKGIPEFQDNPLLITTVQDVRIIRLTRDRLVYPLIAALVIAIIVVFVVWVKPMKL